MNVSLGCISLQAGVVLLMRSHAASTSFIREQEGTNKLKVLDTHLFEKKPSCAPPSHLPCTATTLSALETICSLSKVERTGIRASPADVYVYGDSHSGA